MISKKQKRIICKVQGTSNNTERHSELVSESPKHKEIADQVHNDGEGIDGVIRSPLHIGRTIITPVVDEMPVTYSASDFGSMITFLAEEEAWIKPSF